MRELNQFVMGSSGGTETIILGPFLKGPGL